MRYINKIYVFKDKKHLSDFLFKLRGGNIVCESPIIYENIDMLNADFRELRKSNPWMPQSSKRCPLCSWNNEDMIITGFIIGEKTIAEIYQKCFHVIYELDSIAAASKKKRNTYTRIRENFSYIISNWENWMTHLNRIGSVF